MTTDDNELVAVATDGGVEALESAWLERMNDPPEARVFLDAFAALSEPHQRSAAPTLLGVLFEAYQSREAHADALAVLQLLLPHRPRNLDAQEVVNDTLEKLYGGEEWFSLFVELSQLEDDDIGDALDRFLQLVRLLPGSPVFHKTGWGEGIVTDIDLPERSFFVTFRREGRSRSMPFTTGLDVLRPLPLDDLRARLLADMDGLKSDATENPSVLIRAVARLHKGRATSKEIKTWLVEGGVIETSGWNSWWRKAKVAAAHDPWLQVENPSRPLFILRKRPLSASDEIIVAMDRARTLTELLEVVRGPLSLDPAEDVRVAMLDRLELGLADGGKDVARIEAALLLYKGERKTQAEAGQVIQQLLAEEGAAGFGDMMARLKPATLRKDAFDAFVAADPKLWSDSVIGELPSLPGSVLEAAAEKLVADGRGAALANRMSIYLMTPSRQPVCVLRLAKKFAAGLFKDVEGAPSTNDVIMGLLHLVETQAPKASREDREARDILKGVSTLLFDKKRGLLAAFMAQARKADMERVMGVMLRTRAIPDDIEAALKAVCHERFPDLVPRDETPFWERQGIFSTKEGLARRQEEYRVLIEEKIPENSETIGKAASFGDLSENYEWAAAIEQQRQLTEKAAAMEAELRLARAIEDEELEEGVVSPGMRVEYTEGGKAKSLTILGPWDHGEGVVSYRAPIAAGMLGCKAGDTATLDLPQGAVEVIVQSVTQVVESAVE